MSATGTWTEWCLTPRGWQRGSHTSSVVLRPRDWVLVSCYMEVRDECDVRLEWRNDDVESVSDLLEVFGPAPRCL